MAFINMRMEYDLFNTPIPNTFIDDYMLSANPAYVTVYILGYRHCFSGNSEATTQDIADKLNLLESDVVNAWRYWESVGLIKIHESSDKKLEIEFLRIKPKLEETPKAAVALQEKVNYSVKEIELYMDKSIEVRELFAMAQRHLSKLLTHNDMKTIFGLYDWLGLPFEVIDALLEYCAHNNHKSMRYIETVAMDWSENDIRTAADAQEYLALFNGDYRRIMKAFGHTRREPAKAEVNFMKKWLKVFGMPIELIELACAKTIMQTGQAKFPYADKIITDWHDKGVTTSEDVEKLEESFNASKPAAEKSVTKKGAKGKFVNFEQPKWDFDKLQELEYEYLEKDLRGN